MSSLVISISIYLISVNIVAGAIYMFAGKRAGLLAIEYPFVYLPWIALQIVTQGFLDIPELAANSLSLKYFLFMLQGFSCGVMGGMILLPRVFIPAETVREKLKITLIGALIISGFYLLTRYLLLLAFRWLLG